MLRDHSPGAAYLRALRLGQPLSARGANEGPFRGDAEQRYARLLDTVRRERPYFALHRAQHDKALGAGRASQSSEPRRAPARLSHEKASVRCEAFRPRASIFDMDKKLETDEGGQRRATPPATPVPIAKEMGMHSIDVEWEEPSDGGDEIYEYALPRPRPLPLPDPYPRAPH